MTAVGDAFHAASAWLFFHDIPTSPLGLMGMFLLGARLQAAHTNRKARRRG